MTSHDPIPDARRPEPQPDGSASRPAIVAYEIYGYSDMPINPAATERDWMDSTESRFAYRCLPLAIANQCGWVIINPVEFTACWNGGPLSSDTAIRFDNPPGHASITSHFGYGVVTINVPYLFRTPPGINLWAKGPSNWVRDGVQALEGIVETDWSPAPFTMNWKLTRPGYAVRFEKGDPICMLVPIPRGLIESLDPRQIPLASNAVLEEEYKIWDQSRQQFQQLLSSDDPETVRRGWQRDYFHGQTNRGERFDQHQTKLSVRPFVRTER